MDKLKGSLNTINASMHGTLSGQTDLSGALSTGLGGIPYVGEYEVTPRAWNEVILPTTNRVMSRDVTVFRVPYYEMHNENEGLTAYIANEV